MKTRPIIVTIIIREIITKHQHQRCKEEASVYPQPISVAIITLAMKKRSSKYKREDRRRYQKLIIIIMPKGTTMIVAATTTTKTRTASQLQHT
jgi:transcriptional/translational regulatory protein YebC/TACO1